jgi:hypothetical protein
VKISHLQITLFFHRVLTYKNLTCGRGNVVIASTWDVKVEISLGHCLYDECDDIVAWFLSEQAGSGTVRGRAFRALFRGISSTVKPHLRGKFEQMLFICTT